MISYRKFWIVGVSSIIIALAIQSCATKSIVMKPSTIIQRDVFVCKGLSEDNNWVGITDQFLPTKDLQVVVVAFLDSLDAEKVINVELLNPMDNVAATETLLRPKERSIGIYFSMPSLIKLGGEGEWKATVFADGEAIGESKFYIGEKPVKDEKGEGPRYYVVGSESEEETGDESDSKRSEEDRFSSYIREATPNLTIPLPDSLPSESKSADK